jgi:hypothetical protein
MNDSVSAPFRGTQIVYILGECTHNAPTVRPWSVGSLVTKCVHIASYLSPFMPSFLDMHADSRSLSFWDTSFSSFLRSLRKSDWAESRDASPFDVTFQGVDMREANLEGLPHPGTFYRSYVACMVSRQLLFPATALSDVSPLRPSLSLIQGTPTHHPYDICSWYLHYTSCRV